MQARRSKFGNIKTSVDGLVFDSKREATFYSNLKLLERARLVRNIRRQVVYALIVNEVHICNYRADFVGEEADGGVWEPAVWDVKGYRTREYLLKKKLMKAVYGIDIREV